MAMAAIGLAMSAGSMVTGVVNAANAQSAQDKAYDYNKQMDLENAKLTLQNSQMDEQRYRVQAAQQLGEERAGYGAGGVQMTGSALDVMRSSAASAEMDAQSIKYKGMMQAYSYQKQAGLEEMNRQAGNAQMPGQIVQSAFGGLGSALSNYNLMRRT